VIEGEPARHLGRVLRAQPGQLYELSDGTHVYLGRIDLVTRDRIEFALLEELPARQPALNVTLLLAIAKFDSFEWALEKATELGVTAIIPLAASRSEKGLVAAAAKRAARWEKILLESSQQSRRLQVPRLGKLAKPEEVFSKSSAGVRLMLSERPEAPPLRTFLSKHTEQRQITLAIGPEGGWTDQELSSARGAGFQEASLGRLVLRTETAVVAALASLNYALGDA